MPTPPTPPPTSTPISLETFFNTPNTEETRIAARSAAAAEVGPEYLRPGNNIGQSSPDANGIGGAVEVIKSPGTDGTFNYAVEVNSSPDFTVSTNPSGSGLTAFTVRRNTPTGEKEEITFQRELVYPSPYTSWDMYVYLRTDTPNSIGDDDDYLAYGFWIADPRGADSNSGGALPDLPAIGAFVSSNEGGKFTHGNLAALTGSATYTGKAHGLYHERVSSTADFATFEADAGFVASFGNATAPGAITGSVTTFTFTNPDVTTRYAGLSINLPRATIIDPALGNGFYRSSAIVQMLAVDSADTAFTGNWGGQFFDDGAAAADHPGTVAGTFGFADADGIRSFLGIFWADRTSP